jgi:hypothetical protein
MLVCVLAIYPTVQQLFNNLRFHFFSISLLKTNELEKYLVVARRTEMWLRMHGVPPNFPHSERRSTYGGFGRSNSSEVSATRTRPGPEET